MADDWTITGGPQGTLTPDTMIGPYRVDSHLGEGGMGTVFRATDTKLNRAVAIKVLSDDFADAAARRRFQREAQLASSLNHPHILTVYDAGEFEGRQYLVTEFVDGGTLKDWAKAEKHTWRQIVELLTGVADGLAAAHAAGITHRDIKPANILIAKNGYAKLADFGLAKLTDEGDAEATGTLTEGRTKPGTVIGTLAYMSPEQASGLKLDARSDIFSFGVVLYEMLAGKLPFSAKTQLELLKTIIHAPHATWPGEVPVSLRNVVDKALEKDPGDRYQSMREVVVDLRRAARRKPEEELGPPASEVRGRWKPLRTGVVLAAVVAAAALGWFLRAEFAGSRQIDRNVHVQRLTNFPGLEEAPAISPDGRTVAFVAASGGRRQIFLSLLAAGTPSALTNDDVDHDAPRWSPDSASLIYFTPGAEPGDSGVIWELPVLGGRPRQVVDSISDGDLSHDGKRVAFFRFEAGVIELAVVSRDLSSTYVVAKLPPGVYSHPRWSPDDRQIAYTGNFVDFTDNLMLVDASGGEPKSVATGISLRGFAWTPDGSGFILSSSEGSTLSYPPTFNLWKIPAGGGAAIALTFGEFSYEFPDVDAEGNVFVSRMLAQSDIWRYPVTGTPAENVARGVQITRQTGQIQVASVSPDEREVVFLSDNGGHANVWTAGIPDGEMSQVTREADPQVRVAVPLWSPRGDLIQYLSDRDDPGQIRLWVANPDGRNPRDLSVPGAWACWSGDGEWIYYSTQENEILTLRKVRVEGGQSEVVTTDNAIGCAIAPDGSALYYARILAGATGAWDFEIRQMSPDGGPAETIGQVSGTRIPGQPIYMQVDISPDGEWLAAPFMDGSTTNLWALPTSGGEWRKLTDFSPRTVEIERRIGWSRDSTAIYAAVSEIDSDVVILGGLARP